jgi:hypothetical protein
MIEHLLDKHPESLIEAISKKDEPVGHQAARSDEIRILAAPQGMIKRKNKSG